MKLPGPRWQRTIPILATIFLAIAAFAQTQPPPDKPRLGDTNALAPNAEDFEKKIWANAKPYLDYALPELEAAVPELKGLHPASSQEELTSLLNHVGETCVDLLQRTPNVISDEEVITEDRTPLVISHGGVEPWTTPAKPERQRFEYLILSRQTPSGGMLEEHRTDKDGRSVTTEDVFSHGFAAEWVILSISNRPESRFRYLGQQEVDKRETFVLAFAQIPGLVKFPARFLSQPGTWVSVLLQGVVWIDSSDFRIVRMREDLLAPRPDIYLEELTSNIRFDEVHIPGAEVSLWLPQDATIEWEFKGTVLQQRHLYSDYRLFAVKTRILPAVSLAEPGAQSQKKTLTFGGESRAYYMFTPIGLATPAPVLILLHGLGHDGKSLIDLWQGLAQTEGIVLVAPDSSDPADWDYRKDSPDFLHAVLGDVESADAVDTGRVYLFGYSTGAVYALYLSTVESEYFAATAVYEGSLPAGNFKLIASAQRKIPISIWVGTDDTSLPLPQVRATRDAFNARGFTAELHEISGHDQNYDAIAGEVNGAAWQFLKINKLERDRNFQTLAQLLYPFSKSDSPSQSDVDIELTPQSFDREAWARAKPYLDDPLPQLTANVPELHGLNPAPDQQPLAELLKKTSAKSLDLLKRMPNIISHESVVTTVEPRGPTSQEKFEYLVLRHEALGEVMLEEYRIDKAKTGAAPHSQGSANAWVLFHPGNLVESRFRYLGRQRMDGHSTVVLAFAQIPDKVKFPGQVNVQGTLVPVLFQGIAWIDESDFRMVRLRTDLLEPRPDFLLRTLTSEVHFSEVRVPELKDPLWLPQEVKITWDFKGQVMQERHRYSNFRLYRSKVKIVM